MHGVRDRWLVLLGLLGFAIWAGPPPAAAAATRLPLAASPGAPSVVLWNAGDSYADGPLADAQLDRPVRFWRAGLPMEEVIGGIKEQTGVELRFWPPDDQNRRVRVNLYLNPKSPPALRDLLVQLSWVLDCSLACTETEPRAYYLLGPGNTTDAVLEAVARAKAAEQHAEEEGRASIVTWLGECKAALALPPKEMVARYLGVDDRLVLDLIVPWRRVAMQLLTSLPDDEMLELVDGGLVVRQGSDLSAEERASLCAALQLPALPESSRIVLHPRALKITESALADDRWPGAWPGVVRRADSPLLPEPREPLSVAERVGLRRWLGERVSQEEESRLKEEDWQRWQQREAEHQEQEGAEWLAEPELSREVHQRLLETTLTWIPYTGRYALWQVQEATAALTGLNVVSDAFYQPRGDLSGFELLDPEYHREQAALQSQMNQLWATYPGLPDGDSIPEEARKEWHALDEEYHAPHDFPLLYWLALMCRDWGNGSAGWIGAEYNPGGSEWGGGGTFLHFRSTYRQFLAALLLPDEARAGMESLETPPLEQVDFSKRTRPTVGYHLDLREGVRLITLADDLQWRLAGRLIYEDPATPLGAAREEVRESFTGVLTAGADVLRLLATFTPAQWEELTTTGLNCQRDLSPDQQSLPAVREALRQAEAFGQRRSRPSLADITLIAVPIPRDEGSGPGTEVCFHYQEEEWGFRPTDHAFEAPEPVPHLVPLPSPEPGS